MNNDREYTVRDGVPGDAEQIMSVHRRAILELGTSAYSREETISWAAKLRPEGYVKIMTERDEFFEVAVDGENTVIAFCSICANEIKALYVAPDWVRNGIGADLLRRAEDKIAGAGHETAVIDAALSGLPLYLAHGYAIEKEKLSESRGGLKLKSAWLRKSL